MSALTIPERLDGARIALRPARDEDLADLARWTRAGALRGNVWLPDGDPDVVWSELLHAGPAQGVHFWIILHRRDHTPIGFLRIWREKDGRALVPSVAITEPHYLGGRFALEASSVAYDWLFSEHGPAELERVVRRVYADNEQVLAALRRSARMHELPSYVEESSGRTVRTFATERADWLDFAPRWREQVAALPDVPLLPLSGAADFVPGRRLELVGPRLVLRSLRESEVTDELVGWTESPSWARNVWFPTGDRRSVLTTIARHPQGDKFFFLLVRSRATGRLLGFARIVRHPTPDNAVLGLALSDDVERPPVGAEALVTLGRFVLERLGVRTIELRVYEENRNLSKRLQKLGFPLRDVEPELRDGKRRDIHVFVVTHAQWLMLEERAREAGWLPELEEERRPSPERE